MIVAMVSRRSTTLSVAMVGLLGLKVTFVVFRPSASTGAGVALRGADIRDAGVPKAINADSAVGSWTALPFLAAFCLGVTVLAGTPSAAHANAAEEYMKKNLDEKQELVDKELQKDFDKAVKNAPSKADRLKAQQRKLQAIAAKDQVGDVSFEATWRTGGGGAVLSASKGSL